MRAFCRSIECPLNLRASDIQSLHVARRTQSSLGASLALPGEPRVRCRVSKNPGIVDPPASCLSVLLDDDSPQKERLFFLELYSIKLTS